MRTDSIKTMFMYTASLEQLLYAGKTFGTALVCFGKAYLAYQLVCWQEGMDILAKRSRGRASYVAPGSSNIATECYACGSPLSEKGNCTSVHCSREHDRVGSSS
jgi:hypothetical protein